MLGKSLTYARRYASLLLRKAMLLALLLPCSLESESKASEAAEAKTTVEAIWLHRVDGLRRQTPQATDSSATAPQYTGGQLRALICNPYVPQSLGHRLANGLLAPLTC